MFTTDVVKHVVGGVAGSKILVRLGGWRGRRLVIKLTATPMSLNYADRLLIAMDIIAPVLKSSIPISARS